MAAFFGYRILVNFNGTNKFTDNVGGGIVVSESRINVRGTLVLSGNSAVNGGGLAMFGRSLVRTACLSPLHNMLHSIHYDNIAIVTGREVGMTH